MPAPANSSVNVERKEDAKQGVIFYRLTGACFDDVQRHVESLIDDDGKSKEGHFTLPRLESGRYVARGVVVEPSHA